MRGHVQDQMDAYLAEALGPEARRDFERHVQSCRACGDALGEAQSVRGYLQWLVSDEASPEPGPDFYLRVRESIERKQVSGWLGSLSVALHPRLAYPLLVLGLLLMAWALTFPGGNAEDELMAMEFPSAQFAGLSFTEVGQTITYDDVMLSLVEVSEIGGE